jgi:hypothetical protein
VTKPKRARTERRERERALDRTVRALERLAAAAPGGAPDNPVRVSATSVVEVRARATPCPLCQGELDVREHVAEFHKGEQLRRVRVACRACHATRDLWYALGRSLPS